MQTLSGLASGNDLKTIFAQRSKTSDEKTITGSNEKALAHNLAGAKEDGWTELRANKKSIRLKRDKPTDRQLEDDLWSLLYRMGFKELSKDRTFMIHGRQWDVFAKDDETAFICECTHSREGGPKSLKALLDKICAYRDEVVKAIHAHYGKEPKLKIKFAIATRSVEWRDVDRDRATNANIAVITDDDIAYFEKLTGLLKTAARYQFLGRYVSGEKVEGLRTALPATKGHAGGHVFYNFLISPHDLLRIAYISHKSKTSNDDFETYQRMVKPSRLNAIANYIDNGGKFPTNIVINFKSDSPLQFDQKEKFDDTATGILHLPGLYGSAWIIDGQHRLYGYAHASRTSEEDRSVITVLAYENIPLRDEIKLFIDINTEQVKVSRNLVKEIISSLNIDDPDHAKRLDALIAMITLRLDEHPGSPVKGRIVTVSQEKNNYRCLTPTSLADEIRNDKLIGTIVRATKTNKGALMPGPLADASGESKATIEKSVATLSHYLLLFAEKLEAHWQLGDAKGGFLCTNLGVRSLILLLSKLLAFIEAQEGLRAVMMKPADIVDKVVPFIEPLIQFFATADQSEINAFRSRGSSLLSVGQNCFQMMSIISEAIPAFTTPELQRYMDSRDIEGTKKAKDMIDEINKILYDDVIATLKEHYGELKDVWWQQGVPTPIRNECDQRFNNSDGTRDRWQFLLLPNYNDIVLHANNWDLFKDYYNFYGKVKKADAPRWIRKLALARTITHHAEKGPLPKEDVDFVGRVHALVKEHIVDKEEVDGKSNYLENSKLSPPPSKPPDA
jgi:DGQHR domain-containing protein